MADRDSAEIFGFVFEYLAEQPQDERTKALALEMWAKTPGYDFCTYQMGCDEALIKLGLAQRVACEHYDSNLVYAQPDGITFETEEICEDH